MSAKTVTLELTADELHTVRSALSHSWLSTTDPQLWREVTAKVDDAAMRPAVPAARRSDDETLDLAYRVLGALKVTVANEPFQALVKLLAAEVRS